eukprot:6163729-Pleurochrysis_carterae.AAC.1
MAVGKACHAARSYADLSVVCNGPSSGILKYAKQRAAADFTCLQFVGSELARAGDRSRGHRSRGAQHLGGGIAPLGPL